MDVDNLLRLLDTCDVSFFYRCFPLTYASSVLFFQGERSKLDLGQVYTTDGDALVDVAHQSLADYK